MPAPNTAAEIGREGLLALAARVEAATGADRELDYLIWAGIHGGYIESTGHGDRRVVWFNDRGLVKHPVTIGDGIWRKRDLLGDVGNAPAYTVSLDAAMSLVPPTDAATAVFWKLGNDGEGGDPSLFKATILIAHVLTSKGFTAVADTAPLALLSAALKARAVGEGE